MKRIARLFALSAAVLLPISAAERPPSSPVGKWLRRAQRASLAALCASEAADTLSSYRDSHIAGLHETNGFYTPGGKFSINRMIGVKSAICGGFLVASHFTARSEGGALALTTAATALAVPTAYAAINNMRLK